ncbi:ANKRD17 [Symbiodinium pilosum]|uniref:ANKRD17 protein n=1 Tax=Symbiodinium pilosum TaxID=2952 RepID=A0A812R5I5_SYMPI|nr:ANKRD17 [Symbiodinium pilosum]
MSGNAEVRFSRLLKVPLCICSHERFDSVMGDFAIDGQIKFTEPYVHIMQGLGHAVFVERYREFVVYEKQCYPEFCVIYERMPCVEGINEILSVPTAPRILSDSFTILGGPLAEQISKAATDVIAEHFDEYCAEELQRLPPSTLAQILRRDDLSVMHENEIFDFVVDAAGSLASCGRGEEATQLWQSIRFGALSNTYMVKAAKIETIPRMTLIWSKVLNRNGNQNLEKLMNEQCLSEGWPIPAAPNPRKPFKDMTCAVMYSVDTDARNDQDVERNITAATLVAEEIEFLGGRAILENIFARRDMGFEISLTV